MSSLAVSGKSFVGEWHPTRNGSLTPEDVSSGSKKEVWWLGEDCGHEWVMAVGYRSKGFGCPVCVSFGFLHPDIAVEWHPTKNEKTPFEFRANSGVKVWWLGKDCGHEWDADIRGRVRDKYGCPYCVNQRVLKGFNDLETTHPELAKEWHPTKNGELLPTQVTYGSKQKVWWVGAKCGHEWEASILPRASKNVGCGVCRGLQIQLGINDLVTTHPALIKEWHPTKNIKSYDEVTHGSHFKAWWVCSEKAHEWRATVYDRVDGNGCAACSANSYVSKSEKEIADYVSSLGLSLRTSVRDVIKGELDIFVPERNVAIEFNGLYWHNENAGKDKYYHHDKWKACKDKGIQLIQVWEDEWNRNPEQVKSMLAHKLGVSQHRKVSGKKTVIVELSTEDTAFFLNTNHIQGYTQGGIRVGLVEKGNLDNLLAVMVLKSEPGSGGKVLNLLRFATSATVQGGFTKILKYVENTYAPDSIITFSDNCVSDGGLYRNNGFIAVKELEPDYRYVVRGERVHKFSYRLKRFKEDPVLQYEEGLSERELAVLNGLPRIWDAGKTKWERLV